MKKAGFSLLLTFCIACLTHAQQPSSLLFHLSGEDGVVADFARGSGEPHYLSQISVIDDGERQLVLAVPAGGAPARNLPQAGPDDTLCELYESNNTLPL